MAVGIYHLTRICKLGARVEQAGVKPTWIKLADIGIHGNGHDSLLEKNNMDIAGVLLRWLAENVAKDCPNDSRN
jgi:hypothetical protein